MTRVSSVLLALFLFSAQLFAQISSGGTPLSFSVNLDEAPATLSMPELDIAAYIAEDEAAGWDEAPRFGVPHDVTINLDNNGTWTSLRDGRLWRCRIESRGAYSINLQFDEFFMPPGATLFIYNDDKSHVIGAFTERNNKSDRRLGTQPVRGDAITLEYFEPASQIGQGSLSIWRVVHAYRDMFHRGSLDDFGDAAWCSVNINCPEGADWQDEKRGVAMIITGGGYRWCSGSLINNARSDGTPYFHTAKHCTDSENIGSWVFVFGYESPSCEFTADGSLDHSVSGGTLLFTHLDTDIALIEISEDIPLDYNPYFCGWYGEDVAPENTGCISHPATDVMKIGIDNDPAVSSSFGGTPQDSHWRVLQWDAGHAEHGSSGGPMFNQDGLIIGQCHGGDGWCDDVTFHNVDYGKLAWSLDLGADEWLDPDDTGIMTLQAYDPNVAGQIVGTVRNADTQEPINDVLVSVIEGTQRVRTNELGEYRLPLNEGSYDLEYSLWGYETHTELGIAIADGDSLVRNVDLIPLNVVVVLEEDFESGAAGWSHASTSTAWQDQWHISTESSHGGSSSFKCGDTGTQNYMSGLDARLSSPEIFYLPSNAYLSFWMRIESEISGAYPDSAYDGGVIEISVNGGLPEILSEDAISYSHTFRYTTNGITPTTGPMPGMPCFAGLTSTWRQVTADLSDYASQNIRLHFRFGSDNVVDREGWYIDDILIRGIFNGPPSVTGLVIWRDGNDLKLSWDDDETPYYMIFSSFTPEIPFPTFEGMTDQTTFTIVNGFQEWQQFYYVVGYVPE